MGGKRAIVLALGLVMGVGEGVCLAQSVRTHTGQGAGSARLVTGARGGTSIRMTGGRVPVVQRSQTSIKVGGSYWRGHRYGGYHFKETKYGIGLWPKYGHRWPYGCGSWGYGYWPYGQVWLNSSYYGPDLVGEVRRLDPSLLGLDDAPSAPPAPVDEGLDALGSGEWSRAAAIYLDRAETQRRKELEEPGVETNRNDLRLAALALAGDGQMERAALLMNRAYEEDPTLTDRDLSGSALGVGGTELRRMVTRGVALAHRGSTESEQSEAWFLVSVLMLAEGRHDLAREMLARSEGTLASDEGASELVIEPSPIPEVEETSDSEDPDLVDLEESSEPE